MIFHLRNSFTSLAIAMVAYGWLASSGCTLYKVHPPPTQPVSLAMPVAGADYDLLIETVDLIDRTRPIGKLGDFFWGGQYQVVLTRSLHDYFEAETVRAIEAQGLRCARYPGEFAMLRLHSTGPPPLHLRLELQELTFSRIPKTQYHADHIIGSCKVRSAIFDQHQNVLYQRQSVGQLDRFRPTDELVGFLGLLSRPGLSRMLTEVLTSTVQDMKQQGVPEMMITMEEYRRGFDKAPPPGAVSNPADSPINLNDPPEPSRSSRPAVAPTPSAPEDDIDVSF